MLPHAVQSSSLSLLSALAELSTPCLLTLCLLRAVPAAGKELKQSDARRSRIGALNGEISEAVNANQVREAPPPSHSPTPDALLLHLHQSCASGVRPLASPSRTHPLSHTLSPASSRPPHASLRTVRTLRSAARVAAAPPRGCASSKRGYG